jgi:hypothetical protein
VIAANARAPTLVGRVLAASPFVMVGRLSYSIYLWHWPLLTFARLWGISIDGWAARLAILAATLGCAYVSWRFVEVPFRTSAALPSRVRFVALAGGAFSLAAISGVAVATEGLPVRLDKDIRGMLAYQSYPPKPALYREGACFLRLDQPAADFDESKCADRQPGRADLLLWGDSHAAHYAPGMRQEARRFDINVVQATYAGCPPIPFRAGISASCADFGKRIWQMAQTEKFDAIVLSANWTGYQAVLPELSGVVRELAQTGRPVVVIGPSVEFSSALPVLLSARRPGAGTHLRQAGGWLLKAAVDLDVRMRELLGAMPNVLYVSPISEVCPDRVCPVLLENGVPLTWDSSHLTAEGSALVSALLLKRMSSVVRRQGLQADHSKL